MPMNNKAIGVILGIAVIIVSGGLALNQPKKIATVIASGYTLAQVATHNNEGSCWSIVNGNVYNLTDWIGSHPGGEQAIIGMCGIDASDAFNGQHGGQRRPTSELAGFKIGALIQ